MLAFKLWSRTVGEGYSGSPIHEHVFLWRSLEPTKNDLMLADDVRINV